MISHKPEMERLEWENFLSIDIPKTWMFREEDGVISLFDEENGVGVLQFSLIRRKSPQEPSDQEVMVFAEDYASKRGWVVPSGSIHTLDIAGSPATEFSVQESNDGELEYWRVWHIMGKERMAFVTYNCIASDKKVEANICDLIVSSFRWL